MGLGSLQVKARGDNREILNGDMISNDLEQDLYALDLPSHVLVDVDGKLFLRLINRAQNSLLPIHDVTLHGPDAVDFVLAHDALEQLGSSEELQLEIAYRPRRPRYGLRQAILRISTGDPVNPRFELLLAVYPGPGSDG